MSDDGNRFRSGEPAAATLLYILFGPCIWALHLTVSYASQSAICAFSRDEARSFPAVEAVVGGATVAAVLLVGFAMWKHALTRRLLGARHAGAPEEMRFQDQISRLLALLATIGIVYGGATILVLHPCASLR